MLNWLDFMGVPRSPILYGPIKVVFIPLSALIKLDTVDIFFRPVTSGSAAPPGILTGLRRPHIDLIEVLIG